MGDLPFKEKIFNKKVIRTFDSSLDEEELKWHYDLKDRIIIPMNINDWQFQKDNQLPEKIDKKIHIKAKEWHRVIKGKTDLVVEIIEN
jgi:hypothetical protein